jgi:Tol biopolymer transport system component
LQKDHIRRYGSAQDLRQDLEVVKQDIEAGLGPGSGTTSIPFRRQPVVILTVLLTLTIGILGTWFLRPPSARLVRKFQIPDAMFSTIHDGPAISPDGSKIVYARDGRLWIRELSQVEPRELSDTDGGGLPFWAPGSDAVGYVTGRELKTVSDRGGPSTSLCILPDAFFGGAVWRSDGIIVFSSVNDATNGTLFEVSARGGEPRPFLEPDSSNGETGFFTPHLLPDGQTLLFTRARRNDNGETTWNLVVFTGDTRTPVLSDQKERLLMPVYAPSGHLLYYRISTDNSEQSIWSVEFDPSRRTMMGEPFLVIRNGTVPGVSSDGTLVYRTIPGMEQLAWVDRSGTTTGLIGQPRRHIIAPSVSPDESMIAAGVRQQDNVDVWIYDIARDTGMPWTSDPAEDSEPAWNPVGDRIAFVSKRNGNADIFIKPVDGSDEAKPVVTEPSEDYNPDWSRDGKYLVYHAVALERNSNADLWYIPLTQNRRPVSLLQTPDTELFPVLSPDGRYVVYVSNETGNIEVWVRPCPPEGEAKWQISVNSGSDPRWNNRGDELYYLEIATRTFMMVKVTTRPSFTHDPPQKLFTQAEGGMVNRGQNRRYDVAGDGQRFVVVQQAEPPEIIVVLNWYAEFSDRK